MSSSYLYKNDKYCNYIKLKRLGDGTFSEVYEVYKKDDENTHYALKEITIESEYQIGMRDLAEWFVEAMILSSSDHPNIIKAKDIFFECDMSINIKTPRIRILLEKGEDEIYSIYNSSIEYKLKVFYQIFSGLDFLHKNNVIHGDMKPSNIIMFGNTPKIADFGLSSFSYYVNQRNKIVVTEHYRAPEIYKEDRRYDEKIDIYSIGIILFEICCLKDKYLFYDQEEYELDKQSIYKSKKKYAEDPDKYLDSKVGDTSSIKYYDLIKNLTKSCLQYDSKARPSASEILEKIENILGYEEVKEFKNIESRWLTSDLEIPSHIDKKVEEIFGGKKYKKIKSYWKNVPSFYDNYKKMCKELLSSYNSNLNEKDIMYTAYIIYTSMINKVYDDMEELIHKFGDIETVLEIISVYCDKTKFRFFNP